MAISIEKQGVPPDAGRPDHGSAGHGGLLEGFSQLFIAPVKSTELLFFTSQLSLMLEIETPLNTALKALKDQTENRTFNGVLGSAIKDIEEGRQLSFALKKHPRIFSNIFTSLVAAGESGGFLKDILDRNVEILEKRQALVTQLKSALTYPLVLCAVSVLVVIFIMVSILPKFSAFFKGKESVLPATTRFFMATSALLREYWWLFILSGIVFIIGIVLFKESKRGKIIKDWMLVNFPLVSGLMNKIYTCQFLRTLGHLMESHVPLLEALEVTRGTMNNRYFRQLISQISTHVQEGGKFSQPFAGYPYAPASVKQMVATGEEAGSLSKVMLRLSEFYDTEVDKELKTFSALIEPAALIIMGVVIGLIVSSIILPLFRLAHVLQ